MDQYVWFGIIFFLHWIPFLMQPFYFSEIGTSPRSVLACGPLNLGLSPPTLKQEIFFMYKENVLTTTPWSHKLLFFIFFVKILSEDSWSGVGTAGWELTRNKHGIFCCITGVLKPIIIVIVTPTPKGTTAIVLTPLFFFFFFQFIYKPTV